jgi:hypothetical protein
MQLSSRRSRFRFCSLFCFPAERLELAFLAAAILCAGCHHVTVIAGAPAATTTVAKQWQNSFVYGLVPPPELTPTDCCQQGVAKVETERSFLNGLVSAIT